MTSTSATAKSAFPGVAGGISDATMAALETAFGDTLWGVLRVYLKDGEDACGCLAAAAACSHWQEVVRQGLRIGNLAHDLDFRAVLTASRNLADATHIAGNAHVIRNAAQLLVMEFERTRLALEARFPGLVASETASVA